MKRINSIFLILTAVILSACSKELMPVLNSETTAIVESYLYAGDGVITIKLTRLLPFSEGTSDATQYITGQHLFINGAELTETGDGIYTLDLGNKQIEPGESYNLKFAYFSDTVSSETTIPDKPANFSISSNIIYTDRITSSGGFPGGHLADLDLTWTNNNAGYYYVLIEYLESTRDYINYNDATSDISTVQSIEPMSSSGTRLGMRNLYFFGSYRIVLFRVNKDFVDLYQQTSANSNNITNPVTSVNNGFGVFTGMASDTVYLIVLPN